MQIYWILFDEHPQALQHLYDLQMRRYGTKLDVPKESDISTIRHYRLPVCHPAKETNWDKEIRLPALHQRGVV